MNLLSPPASEAQWIESPTNDGNGCRFDSDPGQETKKAPEVRGFFNAQMEHPINDGSPILSTEVKIKISKFVKLLSVHLYLGVISIQSCADWETN